MWPGSLFFFLFVIYFSQTYTHIVDFFSFLEEHILDKFDRGTELSDQKKSTRLINGTYFYCTLPI